MKMAKKKNAKQRREEEKNRLKAKIEKFKIKYAEQETVDKITEEIAQSDKIMRTESILVQHTKKSLAKASGVKSVFIKDDEVIMTSFGRGNDAVVEKIIKDNNVDEKNTKPAYEIVDIEKNGDLIKVQSRRCKNIESANTELPPEKIGMDLIRCKDKLEEIYFGRTFNDNIHIQLIYNILDIEKILSVYINNAVYALGNLERKENDKEKDLVGYLSARAGYNKVINKAINDEKIKDRIEDLKEFIENGNRLGYFGDIFFKKEEVSKNGKKPKKVEVLKSEKEIFDILALLGSLRQFCFHYDEAVFENEDGVIDKEYNDNYWLYNLEKLEPEFKDTLDYFYNRKINDINKGFIKTNQINLHIICDELGLNWDKEQVVGDYYDFLIAKKYKNIGFSIKKIREHMFDIYEAFDIKDKRFDSVRSIMYKIIDFVIYYSFIHYKQDEVDEIVNYLRSTLSEEQKKEKYIKLAGNIWAEYKTQFNKLKDILLANIKEFSDAKEDDVYYEEFKNFKFNEVGKEKLGENAEYFCKLMYLLTLFLDGKEINDLLTTLINKFDNIRSFVELMKEENIECIFDKKFAFFDESKNVCSTLREINSFARMQKPLNNVSVKREMYKDAIKILLKDTRAEEQNIDRILNEYIPSKEDKGIKKDFRNFIIKNIIKSNRFMYLVKYSNPTDVRNLASNRNVVKFVLNAIPDTQIDRYYKSCIQHYSNEVDKETQIQELTDIITGIDYLDFLDVRQSYRNEDKSKKQAVVTLYLTILYILTKNLVNVNSRYVIALHCLERDSKLYGYTKLSKKNNKKLEKIKPPKYHELTKYFIDNRYFDRKKKNKKYGEYTSKKISTYIETNMKNFIGCEQFRTPERYRDTQIDMFVKYRNSIAHLNAVRKASKYINDIRGFDTYFELYHYIMQRDLKDILEKIAEGAAKETEEGQKQDELLKTYFDNLDKYGTYVKDFVKALNIPFAYNYPRYKNLSIDELFDKNNTRKTIKIQDKKLEERT